MSPIKVLHLARLVGAKSFGIGPVVLGLASAQQKLGLQVEVWTQDIESELRELEHSYGLLPETIHRFPHIGPSRLGFSPWMEREVIVRAQEFDVIHQHGFWTAIARVTNVWQDHGNGKTVITPHGTLDPWALRKSAWKKRLSLWLYARRNLARAGCLHALSRREAEAVRQFGIRQPVAVIPNGVSQSWLQSHGNKFRFLKRVGVPNDTRIMLFLGRITPIKGLPMLVHALHRVRDHLGNWRLIIAGVDEFGHEQEVKGLTAQLNMQHFVHFVGPLYGQDKRDAFAAAQFFILPSYSEGYPVVILEALGAGVPVLTTKASPWEDLHVYRCGWATDISVDGIANALAQIIVLPAEDLYEMGQRGKKLVASQYTWPNLAEKTLQLYEWLAEPTKAPPDFLSIRDR